MDRKPLREVVGDASYSFLVNKLLNSRSVSADGVAGFGEVPYETDSEIYKVTAKVVDVEEITKNAKGSCKHCNFGKGYYVINIPKTTLKDPRGHMVLDTDPPENITEEAKEVWLAKKNKETTWKIVRVCTCAIAESLKKNPHLIVDSNHTVFIEAEYTVEPK